MSAPGRSAGAPGRPGAGTAQVAATASGADIDASSARRRRRLHLRGPIWLLMILLFLGAVFVLIDRTATAVAQDKVATKLTGQAPFTSRPKVVIRGFPFLTQALRGRYRDIEVSGPGRPIPELGIVSITANLHGVHIPLSSIGSGVGSVPVDEIDMQVRVPVSRVGAAVGVPGLKLTQSGKNIKIVAPITAPLLGSVTVNATGRLSVNAKQISTTVSSVRVVGRPLPAALAEQLKKSLSVQLPISGLGLNVKAGAVRVVGSTVLLTGSGKNVVLH